MFGQPRQAPRRLVRHLGQALAVAALQGVRRSLQPGVHPGQRPGGEIQALPHHQRGGVLGYSALRRGFPLGDYNIGSACRRKLREYAPAVAVSSGGEGQRAAREQRPDRPGDPPEAAQPGAYDRGKAHRPGFHRPGAPGSAQPEYSRRSGDGSLRRAALLRAPHQIVRRQQPACVAGRVVQPAEGHEYKPGGQRGEGAVVVLRRVESARCHLLVQQHNARREYSGGQSGNNTAEERRRADVIRARREERRGRRDKPLHYAVRLNAPRPWNESPGEGYHQSAQPRESPGESAQERPGGSPGVHPHAPSAKPCRQRGGAGRASAGAKLHQQSA